VKALQDLGAKNGFDVDTTTNSTYFQEDSLKNMQPLFFTNYWRYFKWQ